MKFGAIADLHANNRPPRNRKKPYLIHCLNKFQDILELTLDETDSNVLVVGGDFFDDANMDHDVVRAFIKLIKQYDIEILVVPGQHDLRFHRNEGFANTPLGVLEAAECVTMLRPDVAYVPETGGGVSFVGAGWNEEPSVEGNVLVIHRMVTAFDPLYSGQIDYTAAPNILKRYPNFDCIISGDNHKPHYYNPTDMKGINVNCGSVMRKSKDQVNFKPLMWLIGAEEDGGYTAQSAEIAIAPSEEVFDFVKIEKQERNEEAAKKQNEINEKEMDAFIGSLNTPERKRPKFKTILKNVIDKDKPSEGCIKELNEIMEKVS